MRVCVCVRARARARVCVRARACVRACARARLCMCFLCVWGGGEWVGVCGNMAAPCLYVVINITFSGRILPSIYEKKSVGEE